MEFGGIPMIFQEVNFASLAPKWCMYFVITDVNIGN